MMTQNLKNAGRLAKLKIGRSQPDEFVSTLVLKSIQYICT
jgi:hypothetical protein